MQNRNELHALRPAADGAYRFSYGFCFGGRECIYLPISPIVALLQVTALPLFPAKSEVFAWIKDGRKTIDVRKGKAWRGEIAVVQSGASYLRLKIIKKETGKLADIIRAENYRSIIPTAKSLQSARDYLHGLYEDGDGLFTAYYLEPPTE